jgi:hypothetical protein
MTIKKYRVGGTGDPVRAAASESTGIAMPSFDPAMLDAMEERRAFEAMATQVEPGNIGSPYGVNDPAGLKNLNPLFEILSFGGPQLFKSIGREGIAKIARYVSKSSPEELASKRVKDIILESTAPARALADRRAKENLQYTAERAIKQAGAEDSGALINLQSGADAILDDAIHNEISNRIKFQNQIDDVFGEAMIDDLVRVRDVGDVRDVARIQKGDPMELGEEYAKLFEDLGLTKEQAMQMLEERFMMDPDAVSLPISAYGKQTQRLNKNGGVVPIKKAKKGMRLKKSCNC